MIFVFGTRLFGKVDEVPGLFHVATRFGHLNFLPLVPVQSYVILSQQGGSFQGVAIPLSGKSILIAWARAVGVIAAAVCGAIGLFALAGGRGGETAAPLLGAAAFGAGLFAFTRLYRGVTLRQLREGLRVGRQIGLTERGMAAIYQAYGQAGGRGFEVVSEPAPYAAYAGADAGDGYAGDGYAAGGYGETDTGDGDRMAAVPAPSFHSPVPFFVTGLNSAGQTTCVTIHADDADAARTLGRDRGIDVRQVEYAGPRPRR